MNWPRILLATGIVAAAVGGSFYLNPKVGQEARSFVATAVRPVALTAPPTATPAYVAAQSLPAYHVLRAGAYKCNQKASSGCAALTSPEGKLLLAALAANAPIKTTDVLTAELAANIVTVAIDGGRGLASQLRPGDIVDLYVGPRSAMGAKGATTVLPLPADAPTGALAAGARVLNVTAGDAGYQVTLGLTAAESDAAAAIARLASVGEFYLALHPRESVAQP